MVPFNDLRRQYTSIHTEIDRAIRRVLHKGIFILGEEVETFEKEFAEYLIDNSVNSEYSENSVNPDRQIGLKQIISIGVGCGTDALTLSLKALGLGKGDEVILPANSYPSVFGVALSGVTIRLVDVDENGLLDCEKLEQAITKRTKAVIPVHLYGNPCDIFRVQNVLKRFNRKISIIEDCAQSVGAKIKLKSQGSKFTEDSSQKTVHRKQFTENSSQKTVNKLQRGVSENCELKTINYTTGTIGDIGIFSFYPTKNLGAYGDGGMITTKNSTIAERVRQLRMYGEVSRYKSIRISGVSRLDELQAAVLRVKLKHLKTWTEKRREIALQYNQSLKEIEKISVLTNDSSIQIQSSNDKFQIKSKVQSSNDQINNPTSNISSSVFNSSSLITHHSSQPYYHSVFHLFVIRIKKRDQFQSYLEKKGIGTAIHYPYPIHLTESFKELGYKKGDFPVTEALCKEVLSLPMYPELKKKEITEIDSNIFTYFR